MRRVALSEIAQIHSGGRLGLSGKHFSEEGTVPAYGAAGLNGYLDTAEYVQREGVILSSIGARCGKCFHVDGSWTSLANTQVILPEQRDVSARYLWHILNNETRWPRSGSAQPFIKPSDVKKHVVPLPPLVEQRRIAAILDRASTQLENTRRAASLLESLGQAVFHQMFSDRNCETVLLGDLIAQHQLGLDKRTSELGPLGEFSYLKMDSITSAGGLDLSRATRVDCSPEEFEKYSLREGDLIFNTRNARNLVGKSTVYRGPVTIFNNNILRLRFAETVHPDFIHQFLWSKDGRQQLDARKSGTTSVWAIYFKSLKTIKVPVPDLESQTKFSIRLRNARTQVERYRKREASLEKLLRSLESRALHGEL